MSDPYRLHNFGLFLAAMNDKRALDHLTIDLQRTAAAVKHAVDEHHVKAKGEMLITITLEADPSKPARLTAKLSTKLKLPNGPTEADILFIDDKGNLTLSDPGKDSLFPNAVFGRNRPQFDATVARPDIDDDDETEGNA